jgi:coproporphyrinogen III oxidase-like Fe-S oxidoreductase
MKDNNIGFLTDLGLITLSNDRLSVNANGRLVLNQIINKLSEDSFY